MNCYQPLWSYWELFGRQSGIEKMVSNFVENCSPEHSALTLKHKDDCVKITCDGPESFSTLG